MDVLVTIGTVSIYLYSVYMLFFSPHAAHGMLEHIANLVIGVAAGALACAIVLPAMKGR